MTTVKSQRAKSLKRTSVGPPLSFHQNFFFLVKFPKLLENSDITPGRDIQNMRVDEGSI